MVDGRFPSNNDGSNLMLIGQYSELNNTYPRLKCLPTITGARLPAGGTKTAKACILQLKNKRTDTVKFPSDIDLIQINTGN